ncbi:thrombospondin type-1 domain-containing protein 7B isoform X3 [Girardinichthys multiradiatus]|uniref:thrombospondin type-1 domain-containing protein 7B isoform X3 n=1 Tax=Girardinichthys multiradiatus TaxID=208333 RepID=UPI001FAD8A11|nr:thrombospondin type-1 domain-containing protein 7B isoform X3 [Girardinichthys multiradiatus]
MGWIMILKDDFGVSAWTRHTGNFLSLFLLFLCLCSIPAHSDIVLPKAHHFSWKAGAWGQCFSEVCGSGGVQTRTIWCIHLEGWTTHHSHCQQVEKPESKRQCFKVCDGHQDLFEWEISDWGGCVLVPFFSNELKVRTTDCITAQHGIQRRNIHCIRTSNRSTVNIRICEFFSQKPPVEQACLIPCPQDCVVSDFTSWSSCSKTCSAGLQHRTRHVLATPMYGGANCPNLTETRTCTNSVDCPVSESEYQYSLKVGAWSKCRLPHNKDVLLSGRTTVDFGASSSENNSITLHTSDSHHHFHHYHHHAHAHVRYPMTWELEVGYQTRHVRCARNDGKNVMLSLCMKDNSPLTFQACVMPKDCQISDWSSWSYCSKTCRSTDLSPGYRVRTRIITQIPNGGGKQCPYLEEKEACNIIGDLLSKCPRYMWRTTDWGECRIRPLLSQQDQRRTNISMLCGGGVQTRKTYCVQISDDSAPHYRKEVSRPVNAWLCDGDDPPLAVQNCSIRCQHQCLLSQWSLWSACLHENCKERQGRKGFRQRKREVLWESSNTLGTCPHLMEFIPCEDPACYLWQIQQKEKCISTNSSCGPGTAVQNVTCVNTEGGDMPDTHCVDDPPPTKEACNVACSADCVVDSWSSWSSCSHSCATKTAEGKQSRTRTVLAIPGKDGKACPATPALEEWRVCNDHPCTVFYWETSEWGFCTEDASSKFNEISLWNGTSSCSVGVQSRNVSCMKMNAGPVISKRCLDSSRPETNRPCLLPCKKDCVVTPFSEWTACPTSCLPDNSTAAMQSRYRIIIQMSANGGQECPDTLYEERECDSVRVCPVYRWRMHKWHSCTLVPDSVRRGLSGSGEACGNGLETRGISCVGEDGEPANMTQCLQWAGPFPSQIRECRVACKDDCTLTAWSKFSECAGCGSSCTRRRSLVGRSKKKERCLNEDLYPLEENKTCPCDQFLSQPFGNWSACILPSPPVFKSLQGWMRHREIKECGQGLRYRAVACINHLGYLVNPALCIDSGYIVEVCHIPCPLDCKLSEWSSWSACSSSCGSGLKIRSKWLREKAFNGGRPCPKLDLKNQVYEAVPCNRECSQYEWRIEPWSICTINTVDDLPACGEGVQSRKIRCVMKGTLSGEDGSVDVNLCDQEEMPPRAQVCYLACPNDCVVAPWGAWSNCPPQCDPDGARNRSRHILRLPASEKAVCPELVQSEPCLLNTTCFTYQYRVSDWSTCQLSESAICGEGSRSRLLDCVRSDGKTMELQKCRQFGLINKLQLLESCVVDCPVSCILTDWSPWADCSLTCGTQGHSVRTRRILQEAHEEGRPCPSQLTQTKPCPIRPCYMWLMNGWSACTVEGAKCGEGVRRRNLSCVVHWGNLHESPPPQPVNRDLCGDVLKQQLQQEMEQPCFVPCPGDCHLTEWSTWSSCQLTCLEGRSFESTGRQARSRAVIIQAMENQGSCPYQVFETQPCKGGKCHSYQWKTGGWTNNKRAVWCQRSDGVNVTGGCFAQKRPTTLRHCHPPCTKPFSHCTPSGVCGCEKGYTEVMTSHGFLDYCTRTPGVDNSKKADVKTNSGRLKPRPSQANDLFSEWTLRPIGQDGRVKLWVYAVTVVGFIVILFIIALSFLICKPSKTSKASPPPQKPLTLAYDGDVDM